MLTEQVKMKEKKKDNDKIKKSRFKRRAPVVFLMKWNTCKGYNVGWS